MNITQIFLPRAYMPLVACAVVAIVAFWPHSTFALTNITTCGQLEDIASDLDEDYTLGNDIDCSGVDAFTPIGSFVAPFTGTLDGQGFTINNLSVSTTYAGLFASIGSGAIVENIGFEDPYIDGNTYSGVLTSYLAGGSVSHVYVGNGTLICANAFCGGLVGYMYNIASTVTSSYSNVSILTGSHKGGIVGRFSTGTLDMVYATGLMTGTNKHGILGSIDGGVTPSVSNSFYDEETTGAADNNYGTPTSTAAMMTQSTFSGWDFTVAGNGTIGDWIMAGYPHLQMEHRSAITTLTELQLMAVDLTDDYTLSNDIDSSSTTAWNGGSGFDPIGDNSAKFTGTFDGNGKVISNLFIDRTSLTYVGLFGYIGAGSSLTEVGLEDIIVRSQTYSGGLVGASQGTVSQSYTTGVVTSTGQAIGGLVGYNNGGTVRNSYSMAAVSSTIDVEIGGLVGWNDSGTITNSYATGLVNNGVEAHDGMDSVGGLVGFSFGGTITNIFWDEETSGQDFSWVGTGKTSAEMKLAATYTETDTDGLTSAWDFLYDPNDDEATSSIWHIHASVNSGYPFLAWQALVETTQPTITNVSSDKINGSYTVGEEIDIDVTFSEVVTSTGNVTITLETGDTDRTCTFTVSGSTTGTCTYTVQSGDSSGDLTVSSISGTINDGYDNPMSNFSPTTNLAANKTLVIDTAVPTITLLGGATVSQNQGQTYTDAGATASDAIDGDISDNITTSGSVNTNVPGTYTITYSVSDIAGNAATNVTRTVIILSVGGGSFTPPGGVGSGSTDRPVDMYKTKHIGEISVEGINLLAYIHATAIFSLVESSSGLLEEHRLTIMDLDLSEQKEVTIQVASTPHTIVLKIGASADMDLNSDGFGDLSVTFATLWNNRVELTLKARARGEETTATTATPHQSEENAGSLEEKETPHCPSPLFVTDMKKGQYGPSVMAVQQYLNSIGTRVAISGPGSSGQETLYFGSLTEQALIVFQKGHSLAATGVFDSSTRKYLGCVADSTSVTQPSVSLVRDLKFGMRGEDVKQLQVYLNTNGFPVAVSGYGSAGNETEYFGELTRQAVIAFQIAKGIFPASGYVGSFTRQELQR